MKDGNFFFSNTTATGIFLITQVGLTMMVPIFMCVFVGVILDRCLCTRWIALVSLVLGVGAGFRNTYLLVRGMIKDEDPLETDSLENDSSGRELSESMPEERRK